VIWRAVRRGSLASDGDFYGGEAYRKVLRNFFAVSDAVFDVQADGVLDVLNGFLVGAPLTVTTLKRRARDEIAVRISLYDDRKGDVFHD
jgi:hypothetical protein